MLSKIIKIAAWCAVGCMCGLVVVKSNIIPRILDKMLDSPGGVYHVISMLFAFVGGLAGLTVILILVRKVVRGE